MALVWSLESAARRWWPANRPLDVAAVAGLEVVCYLVAMVPLIVIATRVLKVDWSWESLARLRSGQ